MIKISISIVTYNHKYAELEPTIKSILGCTSTFKLNIIDNSKFDVLRTKIDPSQIDYIFNNSNIGFGAAHNIALKKAKNEGSKYHFVVNPDIHFEDGTIEKIIDFMELNSDIGLLMPIILYPNGNIQHLPKLLPTPIDLLIRRIGILRKVFFNRLSRYEMEKHSDSMTFETPIVSGCFSCFRIEALKKTGLYDETFFMYFEDFDISRRIHKYYKTISFSGASVFHEYERGAQKNSRLFKIFISSAIKYFNKWGWFFDKERKRINKDALTQFML